MFLLFLPVENYLNHLKKDRNRKNYIFYVQINKMEMKKNNNSVLRRLTKKKKKEIWQISIAENLHFSSVRERKNKKRKIQSR